MTTPPSHTDWCSLARMARAATRIVACAAMLSACGGGLTSVGPKTPGAASDPNSPPGADAGPQVAGTPRFVLQAGHSGPVLSVAVSPDGKTIASGSTTGTVRLWDAHRGFLRASLEGHTGLIYSIAFAADGKTLATGSSDSTVRLWDTATGKSKATLEGHDAQVRGVAFSPDSQTLATGGLDKTVRLWDARTGKLRQALEGHKRAIVRVVFSPDGKWVASGSYKTIRVWDAKSGASRRVIGKSSPASLAFSPDGKQIATGDYSHDGETWRPTILLWNVQTGKLDKTLSSGTEAAGDPGKDDLGTIESLAFSPDGRSIATGNSHGIIEFWNVETGVVDRALKGHTGTVNGLAFSANGKYLVSGSLDKSVRVWDAKKGEPQRTLKGYAGSVQSFAFSPDGSRIITANHDSTLQLWDAVNGSHKKTFRGHTDSVWHVAFSRDGKFVASCSSDETVRLWNANTGALDKTLGGHVDPVLSVAFSPDGRLLASGGSDNTVRIWDFRAASLVRTLEGHERMVTSVTFSPDGKSLATGSGDKTVRLWDVETGELRQTLKGHKGWVQAVAFSPDGKTLSSASRDWTVRLWDAKTGATKKTLKGHSKWILSVAFSPDGKLIASGSGDKTVRLWDAKTGATKTVLAGLSGWVKSVQFSPDSKTIATTDANGVIFHRVVDGAAVRLARFTSERGHASLVYTNNGLFSGDESTYSRVMFRVGKDLRRADMLSADQLFDSFHRPSLMQDFREGHPLALLPQVKEGIGLPPSVTFVGTPPGVVKTDLERVRVRVRATERGGGVSEIRVFVNGARQDSQSGDRPAKLLATSDSRAFEQDVQLVLAPGRNVITAEAYNVLGHIRSDRVRRTVVFSGKKRKKPALHMLVMTLSKYADPEMHLNYPNADGDALVAAFERQRDRIFGDVHLHRLRDEQATPARIDEVLSEIAETAQASDVFMMYVSGHGGMVRCPGDESPAYRLLTYRASLRSERTMCAEALAMSRLTRKMRAIRANKKLLLLDSCQSGAATSGDVLLAMRGAAEVDAIKRLARAEGLAILSASTAREYAYEVESLGHGLFTYALLRGLDGGATFRGEKIVSVFGLLRYVDRHLPAIAKRHIRREQRSVQTFQGQDFPIFALHEGDKPLVTEAKSPVKPLAAAGDGLPAASKAKIRKHIDSRRDAVFVCMDLPALSIRARVSRSGAVRFEPYRPKPSPEQGECIVASLGSLRVAPSSGEHTVIHAVSRGGN